MSYYAFAHLFMPISEQLHFCTVDSLFLNQSVSYYTFSLLHSQSMGYYTFLHCLHVQKNMLQHYLAFIALLLVELITMDCDIVIWLRICLYDIWLLFIWDLAAAKIYRVIWSCFWIALFRAVRIIHPFAILKGHARAQVTDRLYTEAWDT